jgi:3-oxoacyl-[acyl-carrier protein] reductase
LSKNLLNQAAAAKLIKIASFKETIMTITTGLRGQRILVTGASQGIGFGVAKAFLEEGARVVINSSNEERVGKASEELSSLGEVHGIAADLSDKAGIDRLVSEAEKALGGIDTLCYSTGSPAQGLFMEKGFNEWEGAAMLLTVSPAYLARKVAEVMIENKTKGKMVFSASTAIKEPIPTIALSNVCRVAIYGLVRMLARELGPKGIRVNGIMPGRIKTSRNEDIIREIAKSKGISVEQATRERAAEVPLGYIGSTEEIAKSFIFFGSELSSYVSGAMLPVDGGLLRSIG